MKVKEHNNINPTGTGLGLSICKLIVEKMRGNIEVNSKVGRGTTFSIIINAKILMKSEPKYAKKFQIERVDECASMQSNSDFSHLSLQRMGGFMSLHTNYIPPV